MLMVGDLLVLGCVGKNFVWEFQVILLLIKKPSMLTDGPTEFSNIRLAISNLNSNDWVNHLAYNGKGQLLFVMKSTFGFL
jgi:hypothetical protein